ncbi:MAG: Uma2 family endonuclease [Phototrophicaceae bacterium]
MVIEKQHMSLDELLALGEDAQIEIVNWEIVDMPAAGMSHQIIAMNILRILDQYVSEKQNELVLPDGMTYLMFSITGGLKDSFVPNGSFVSNDNIPEGFDIEKPHLGAPDLAIEIISPNDNAEIVKTKVKTYLEKGTQQVWLVYPKTQEIEQYTAAHPNLIRNYQGSIALDVDSLFPDIEGLTTDAIFKLPTWDVKDNNN